MAAAAGRIREDGETESVPLDQLRNGDLLMSLSIVIVAVNAQLLRGHELAA